MQPVAVASLIEQAANGSVSNEQQFDDPEESTLQLASAGFHSVSHYFCRFYRRAVLASPLIALLHGNGSAIASPKEVGHFTPQKSAWEKCSAAERLLAHDLLEARLETTCGWRSAGGGRLRGDWNSSTFSSKPVLPQARLI